MTLPRVSVIVCTYNNGATLARSLESLAAQDYPNFHVVAVDDCSSDNSVVIAKDFETRFPVIFRAVKNEKNLGLVGNYSSAWRFFEGEYFLLGGPDDTWAPDFISALVKLLEQNPAASIAMSSVRSQFDEGETEFYDYRSLSDEPKSRAAMASFIVNGVDRDGAKSDPFNSFIHGVGRTKFFQDAFPNDIPFWRIELQIIAMFALLGDLVTVDRPLYTRHRFRQSWEERYPSDTSVAKGLRFWPRIVSALHFGRHAFGCKGLSLKTKLSLPRVLGAIIAFQILRPHLAPRLRRLLPNRIVTVLRGAVYKITNS